MFEVPKQLLCSSYLSEEQKTVLRIMQLDFLLYIRGSFEKEPMQLQQLQYYGGLFFMILATNYLMAYTRATLEQTNTLQSPYIYN